MEARRSAHRTEDVVEQAGVPPESTKDDPEARLYTSEPLENEEGEEVVIQQQDVGPGSELGGGEWPDPDTPPQPPAPGAR